MSSLCVDGQFLVHFHNKCNDIQSMEVLKDPSSTAITELGGPTVLF